MSFYYLFKGFNKRKKDINLIYILIKVYITLYFNNMFLIRVLNKSE